MAEIVSFNPAQGTVTIAAAPGEDLSGWTFESYSKSGNQATLIGSGPVDSSNPQVSASDSTVVYYTSYFGLSTGHTRDAVALVDDSGNLVEVIGWGNDSSFDLVGGTADGASISSGASNYAGDNDQGWYSKSPGGSWNGNNGSSGSGLPTDLQSAPQPCYAAGTLIETPDGPRPIEELRAGDLVSTRDNGPQAILWTHSSEHPLDSLSADRRPVLIRANALGPNRPAQDLIVSPQHRILVGSEDQLAGVSKIEVLAAAKSLTALRGIRHMMGKSKITWVHFAFANHEIVNANGCWAESILLGPMVTLNLPPNEYQTLSRLFPKRSPGAAWNGDPARPCLTVGEARELVAQVKTKAAV